MLETTARLSRSTTLLALAALAFPACASTVVTQADGSAGTGQGSSLDGGPGCGPACSIPETPWSRHYQSGAWITTTAMTADVQGGQ